MNKPYIVGITGGSASGKTRFIQDLLKTFPEKDICLVSQDHYYKDIVDQPKDLLGVENFDLPESIDHEAFQQDLLVLSRGQEVRRKEYTFNNKDREATFLTFKPAPIIVAEGLFSFYSQKSLSLYDLKIFIEANEPVKMVRRILRDKAERGYDLNDVLYRYENHVFPTYEKFIKPYKNEADLIIPNHNSFEKALNVVISHFKNILNGNN